MSEMVVVKRYKSNNYFKFIVLAILIVFFIIYSFQRMNDDFIKVNLIILPLYYFYYWIIAISTWDVYILTNGISFRNRFKLFGTKKYQYAREEMEYVEYNLRTRFGPEIRVYTNKKRKTFQGMTTKQTEEIMDYLKKIKIKVIEG